MYKKHFDIRWSDMDANKHLANSAYTNFMSHTRVSVLKDHGISFKEMYEYDLAPIVFYEHMFYFKETLGTEVYVSAELTGLSEDGMFFSFDHNFYDVSGKHLAHCEMMGAWMHFKERKLVELPQKYYELFNGLPKSRNFKTLTKEDTRKFGKKPVDLSF